MIPACPAEIAHDITTTKTAAMNRWVRFSAVRKQRLEHRRQTKCLADEKPRQSKHRQGRRNAADQRVVSVSQGNNSWTVTERSWLKARPRNFSIGRRKA